MNTPIIILDGPDNVGKGTQLSLLRKHFKGTPFVITNLDRPVGESNEEKKVYGLKAATNQLLTMTHGVKHGIPYLADRAHYTEYAYSMFRDTHNLETFKEIESHIDEELLSSSLSIIFIDTPENIAERDDGASVYTKEDLNGIETLILRFNEAAHASRIETHVINIDEKDIETVHKEVIEIIESKFKELS